jgi:hypothetical protein
LSLGLSDIGLAMNDLALQIRLVYRVEVNDAKRADAGRSEIEQCRTSQAAGSDHQHPGVLQPLLSLHPDIGDDQVTAITAYLVDGQFISGRYQRRQGHGSPPAQRRGDTAATGSSILRVTRLGRVLFRMMG